MTQYTMSMRTATSGLQWRYDFEAPSNEFATEYASRIAATLISLDHFMGLDLWLGTEKHLAYITAKVKADVTIHSDVGGRS